MLAWGTLRVVLFSFGLSSDYHITTIWDSDAEVMHEAPGYIWDIEPTDMQRKSWPLVNCDVCHALRDKWSKMENHMTLIGKEKHFTYTCWQCVRLREGLMDELSARHFICEAKDNFKSRKLRCERDRDRRGKIVCG
jgi:hypothetical protein